MTCNISQISKALIVNIDIISVRFFRLFHGKGTERMGGTVGEIRGAPLPLVVGRANRLGCFLPRIYRQRTMLTSNLKQII